MPADKSAGQQAQAPQEQAPRERTRPAPAPRQARPAAATAAPAARAAESERWTTAWPRWKVAAVAAGLFLLGAIVGLGGAFLHQGWLDVGVRIPLGLLFGLACTAVAGVAGGTLIRARPGAVIPAVGWVLTVIFLTQPRAEGDVIVGGDALGFAFMLGGAVTQLLVTLAVPYDRPDRGGRR